MRRDHRRYRDYVASNVLAPGPPNVLLPPTASEMKDQPEWGAVITSWWEDGEHPSKETLERLVIWFGVPAFARLYLAGRLLDAWNVPQGRPKDPPIPWVWEPEKDWESFVRTVVNHRHHHYSRFETTRRPRTTRETEKPSGHVRPALRWVESRGVWKVKSPRRAAMRSVAGRFRLHSIRSVEALFRKDRPHPEAERPHAQLEARRELERLQVRIAELEAERDRLRARHALPKTPSELIADVLSRSDDTHR